MTRRIFALAAATVLSHVACGPSSNGGGRHNSPTVVVPPAPPPSASAASPPSSSASVPITGECKSDADCVPVDCCHSRSCVAAVNKPSCKGVMCTMDCRAGTLDCGGGSCLCQAGRCIAEMKKRGE